MSTTKATTVTLFDTERLNSSVNGNPRFRLITNKGAYITQSDGACSYDVDNVARKIPSNGNGLPVEIKTTRAGRVWSIEIA